MRERLMAIDDLVAQTERERDDALAREAGLREERDALIYFQQIAQAKVDELREALVTARARLDGIYSRSDFKQGAPPDVLHLLGNVLDGIAAALVDRRRELSDAAPVPTGQASERRRIRFGP
jgi:hypothetical protein